MMGLAFLCAGKIESVVFNKDEGLISRIKTSIICRKQTTEWALDQIVNVRVFKRGYESV